MYTLKLKRGAKVGARQSAVYTHMHPDLPASDKTCHCAALSPDSSRGIGLVLDYHLTIKGDGTRDERRAQHTHGLMLDPAMRATNGQKTSLNREVNKARGKARIVDNFTSYLPCRLVAAPRCKGRGNLPSLWRIDAATLRTFLSAETECMRLTDPAIHSRPGTQPKSGRKRSPTVDTFSMNSRTTPRPSMMHTQARRGKPEGHLIPFAVQASGRCAISRWMLLHVLC